jgi:O-acetyl-ADP-ribose deacetylase (regulator of RNase III)
LKQLSPGKGINLLCTRALIGTTDLIELTRGNLLEAEAEAFVNTVNCVGVMGKGVALQFKQAFPDNFRQYEQACRAKQVRPGQMFIVENSSLVSPKYIINFPTKRHWKGKAKIEDIQSGLKALIADIKRLRIRSVAVPPLGCGNGGLRWSDVRPMIEAAFRETPDVKVLLYEPRGAPEAELMPVKTERPKLTRTRALLLRLLEAYGIPGYRATLLEVQKLAYFLQAAGESLRLKFTKQKYGPYAEPLNHVLQRLEGHFIRGYGDRSNQAGIYLLEGAGDTARQHLENDLAAKEVVGRIGRLIEGFETAYGMELLATVHWVATALPHAAEDVTVAVEEVQNWSARKRSAFREDHIRKAWRRLKDEGWFRDGEPAGYEDHPLYSSTR